MTMPGLRGTSVRRTVIVAVALVTGQALLCAVIGVVTFGDHGRAASPVPRAAEPVAGPPIVVPAPTMPEPRGSSRAPRRHGKAYASSSARPVRPSSPGPRRSRAAATTAPAAALPGRPTAKTSSEPPSPISMLPPLPPDETDAAPVVGEPCDDKGAIGITRGGRVVRCDPDRNGDLRWQRV
ncbi:hypothetical protein [Actinoplanes sp. NPDC049681]|uniref:hypothetical protein n=1 Tax=Actinoplanes sp. NPDC049681 TaxID=3363905 RepID=UPI003797B79C